MRLANQPKGHLREGQPGNGQRQSWQDFVGAPTKIILLDVTGNESKGRQKKATGSTGAAIHIPMVGCKKPRAG